MSSSTLRTRDPRVDHSTAQIGEPVQQIPKFRSLNALHPSHFPSPKRQKKKKHVKPVGGEMFLDPDLVRLPHSFPSFDVATPTPSTTNSHEPPEGEMLAPFLRSDINHVPSVSVDTSNLQQITHLCEAMAQGQAKAEILRVSLFNQAKKGEQTRPAMPVLMVQQDKMVPTIVHKYQKA